MPTPLPPPSLTNKQNATAFYLAVGVFCIDQAITYWQLHFHPTEVILNTHNAWWVHACMLAVCIFFILSRRNSVFLYPLALLIAGGASNLLDRALYGGVADYLFIGSLAFNLGDASVIVGAALLLYSFRT